MKAAALVSGAFLLAAGTVSAGEPVQLTDQQLDTVNAGAFSFAQAIANASATSELDVSVGATYAATATEASTTSTSSTASSASVAASDGAVAALLGP